MAEYESRDFGALGSDVVAISVDDASRSAAVRHELNLSFPILCDTNRAVVEAWGLLNRAEKGGIAFPAVFVVGPGRKIQYQSLDRTGARVSADAVASFLKDGRRATAVRRFRMPAARFWIQGMANALKRGLKTPRS